MCMGNWATARCWPGWRSACSTRPLLSRSHAGRMADTVGPKQTAVVGMAVRPAPSAAVFLLLAYAFERAARGSACPPSSPAGWRWVSASWSARARPPGPSRVGPLHTARVISWNGICTYGGLALGAPLGVYLEREWSMGALGGAVLLLGLAGLGLALARKAVAVVGGHRMAFKSVVLRVFPHGMALAGLGGLRHAGGLRGAVLRQPLWEGRPTRSAPSAARLSACGCCSPARSRVTAASGWHRFSWSKPPGWRCCGWRRAPAWP